MLLKSIGVFALAVFCTAARCGLSNAKGGQLGCSGFQISHRAGPAGGQAALHYSRRADGRTSRGVARNQPIKSGNACARICR